MPIKETAAKKDVHKKEEQEVISELKKMEISKPEDDAENAIRRATKKPLSQEQQKQQVMMVYREITNLNHKKGKEFLSLDEIFEGVSKKITRD